MSSADIAPAVVRPRRSGVPRLALHRPSGHWRVVLDGKSHYLGKSRADAQRRCDELLARWLPTRCLPEGVASEVNVGTTVLRVADVAAKFLAAYAGYFVGGDGQPTGELDNFVRAFDVLLELYGLLPADSFGPRKLKEVQAAMVARGWCRSSVNQNVRRVKRLFKWATSEEHVPASTYHGLLAVDGLRKYRSAAPEPDPVVEVPEKDFEATLPFLPPMVRAMAQLQYLTGMRVSEARLMRTGEVDRTGEVWLFKPQRHKTAHFGRARVIAIGPKAQEVLKPWLKLDPDAPIFSPEVGERLRQKRRRKARKSRVQPSQVARQTERAAAADAREHPPGEVYRLDTYRCAVRRACKKAGVEPWSPAQLRHNAGERIRREFGLEVARCYLGHADIRTTQFYSSMDEAKAKDAAARVG
jgi:integrase